MRIVPVPLKLMCVLAGLAGARACRVLTQFKHIVVRLRCAPCLTDAMQSLPRSARQ